MYSSFRQAELVGKRFLCVREKNNYSLRPNSRSSRVSNPLDYQWKVGIIRACSEEDAHHPDLKVLVEYDKEDWTTREWLRIHDGSWKIFLVEKSMVWSQRPDPSNPRRPLLWPALTFFPLVDYHGLSEEESPVPVEFVGDHEREFVRSDECRPYGQDDDALQPVLRDHPGVLEELHLWQRVQKSQSILLEGPFTLTGFRVKVYRQTCRQWFSAVITAHDLISRELSVMDDTVLQTHRVNPRLVQVILLANEPELDCLLRGEVVRVLPMRQHRHSQVIITAPLTQTTTTSHHPVAPTSWQLYAGLTQASNSSSLENSTQASYPASVASTCTRPSTSSSPSNAQAATKGRRKSAETKNRSSTSRRNTRSDSANSPAPSKESCQHSPQTLESSFTSSSIAPTMSNQRTIVHGSGQLSSKTSPVACTSSAKNSSSSMGSPSSTLSKGSPIKQPMSPKTSPSLLQYNCSPGPKAGVNRSPFRSNPFCSSPDMSSMVSMASPISGMSHMGMHSPGHAGHSRAQSPHPLYSHPMGHLNLSPNQLYALQLQQQQQMQAPEQQDFLTKLWHQHYQNLLHQYQMQCYQLQLILQQQELVQQMPLTPEQQNLLVEYYNQLLHQYQRAQNLQQLAASMCHPIDEQGSAMGTLPERIQQKLRENQERQKAELQNLMPRLEPEQLQTLFACLQQRTMTPEQIKDLYTLLIQQQEAQRRPAYASREQEDDERQKPEIHQYLRQSQEQLQKFLQLPKSLSLSRDAERKQEAKLQTCSSSTQQKLPSSSSSALSPSSSSSPFTLHYLPSQSDSSPSSNGKNKEKPKSVPCVATSSSETPRQLANQGVDEIELKSTTTDEERRSKSPHSILEKLFQDHVLAVKESKQETVKGRKARVSSTETKNRRQRKSAEGTSSKTENKDNGLSKKGSKPITTSSLLSDSSIDSPVSCSSVGVASTVEERLNSSVNENLPESKDEFVANQQELPRNSGLVNGHSSGQKSIATTEEKSIVTKLSEVAPKLVRRESLERLTPPVATRENAEEASPGGPMKWNLNATHKEEPSFGANNLESTKCFNGESMTIDENRFEKKPALSVEDGVAEKDKTSFPASLFEEPSLTTTEMDVASGSENVWAGFVVEKQPKTSELRILLQKNSSNIAAREETKASKSMTIEKETERLGSVTSKGLGTPEGKVSVREVSQSEPTSFSTDSTTDGCKLPLNISKKNRKNNLHKEASSSLVVPPPAESQRPLFSSGTKQVTHSILSSNSSDCSGDLFANKGIKTYSKKLTPVKRKSSAKDGSLEDDSVVSKVVKMDNGKSSETDIRKSVQENRNEERAENLRNALINSKPKPKNSSKQCQLEISSEEKSKRSRKKPTSERKAPSKKAKCEETKTKEGIRNSIEGKTVKHSELGEKNGRVVNSVSFVADQAVEDVAVNHSPTTKDAPLVQFDEDVKLINERLSRSKERIREITTKRKLLKAKDQYRINEKNVSAELPVVAKDKGSNGDKFEKHLSTDLPVVVEEKPLNGKSFKKNLAADLPVVAMLDETSNWESLEKPCVSADLPAIAKDEASNEENFEKNVLADVPVAGKDEPSNGESFASVVDSVLDEKIALIYNGEDCQDVCDDNMLDLNQEEDVKKILKPVKKPEKQRKSRTPSTKEVRKGERKRRARKRSESDGDAVSPTSEQYFLQDHVCAKFSHLPKCRDCRDFQDEKTGFEFCRFNMFRRLRKKKNGRILAAGFQLPDHAAAEDLRPWVTGEKDMMDKDTSLYILFNIGDQFCSVMQEEKKAVTQAGENVSVAYKRAVQGVREMCDVCATTIFNMHWVCHRCGFGVCLDCYNLRVKERQEQSGLVGKRVFEFKWFMCCPGVCHQPKSLSVAQIIPKTVLLDLGDELHRAREVWKIGRSCPCNGFVSRESSGGAEITELCSEAMDTADENKCQNDAMDSYVRNSGKEESSEAAVRGELASSSANQTPVAMDSESSYGCSDDVNLICDESLCVESPNDRQQEWLIEEKRRNHLTTKAGFGLVEAKPDKKVSTGLSLLMDYNSSTEASPCDSPAKNEIKPMPGAFNFAFSSGLDLLVLAAGLDQGNIKQVERKDDNDVAPASRSVATPSESTSAESSDEVRQATPLVPSHLDIEASTEAPHSWLCDGRLLRLHDPRSPGNMKAFEQRWKKGEPVLVSHVDKYLNLDVWTPKSFGQEFGSEIADVVNCRNGVVIEKFTVGGFWEGFESIKDRPLDHNGEPMLLKLKDWPPKDDFSEKLPTRFEDLMKNVPLPEYTRRDGSRNLVSRLPDFFVKPDLGPKMYNAYGSAACPKEGTTNLHLDMSDAVNIMVYVGVPKDQGAGEKEREDAIKAVDEACDGSQRTRVRQETARIGALWHIYAAEDADKIRDCLREIIKERKIKHSQHHDPIHDQCFYLDHDIRHRLKKDYGVEGWAICQCLGDAVFIPAGAPHQVRNLYSCVKVAEDFVSPERIDHCFRMTQEFRHLSDKHTNHEDKLQVKNIIYHAVKDALTSLKHYEQEESLTDEGQRVA